MSNELFIKADDVSKELGISKSCAYKIVQKLNGELKLRNYITVSGRVSRKYFHERVYGLDAREEG